MIEGRYQSEHGVGSLRINRGSGRNSRDRRELENTLSPWSDTGHSVTSYGLNNFRETYHVLRQTESFYT